MAQDQAPNPPQRDYRILDQDTGFLTPYGLNLLDQYWKQIAAGFMSTPCLAEMASNVITLTPRLHREGAETYGSGMIYTAAMYDTSTGPVTAKVKSGTKELATIKVYKDHGLLQADADDIKEGEVRLFVYEAALDNGDGGFVLK